MNMKIQVRQLLGQDSRLRGEPFRTSTRCENRKPRLGLAIPEDDARQLLERG